MKNQKYQLFKKKKILVVSIKKIQLKIYKIKLEKILIFQKLLDSKKKILLHIKNNMKSLSLTENKHIIYNLLSTYINNCLEYK